jgi:hypothetical protein
LCLFLIIIEAVLYIICGWIWMNKCKHKQANK